mmetsp:Transcript_34334/g.75430  ORF Transcript_34334/g.75430 Transcript_34334/m.75430 type:complete len:92 (+) Transcript_34334:117-392(+)
MLYEQVRVKLQAMSAAKAKREAKEAAMQEKLALSGRGEANAQAKPRSKPRLAECARPLPTRLSPIALAMCTGGMQRQIHSLNSFGREKTRR